LIYVLFPEPDPSGERARLIEVVTDIARRLGESLHLPIRAGIGATVDSHSRVVASKRDADQTLRALADEGKGRSIARIEDVRARAILLDLKDLASQNAQLSNGKLAILLEHDRKHNSRFVETLSAFLDCLGDVPAAAKAVNVHPNTFRYRMKRLVELSGLALDDPVERLITHLQLRFLD
jgi:DNA-binding PucR family transcriptional regulator